jgi:uncharacterized membrane protein YraQ (UPF0718 family)
MLLLGTAGLGGLLAARNISDARSLSSVQNQAEGVLGEAAKAGIKEVGQAAALGGQLRVGAIPAILAATLAFALLILVFVKKGVLHLAAGVAVAGAVAVAFNPQYETGAYGPASARSLAIVLAVLGMLGALCAFGAEQLRRRRLRLAGR